MWICLNDGFLSVVADKGSKELLVRARRKADLANVIGSEADIQFTPSCDYAWRTYLSRKAFKQIMVDRIDGINYPNFKDSISPANNDLHDLYLDFWSEHAGYQDDDPKRPQTGLL
jgi:hypothetical protein